MRQVRLLFALLCAVGSTSPALAEQMPNPPPAEASGTQSPASDGTLLSYILSELAARKYALTKTLRKKGAVLPANIEVQWLDGLSSLYAAPQSAAAWVDRSGYLPRSWAVIEEMLQAAAFGLEPAKYTVPPLPDGRITLQQLAAAEINLSLAVVQYAHHAHGGRLNPTDLSLWLDYKPRPVDVRALIMDLMSATDIRTSLRNVHPGHPQFEALRQALMKERGPVPASAGKVIIPLGARISPGQRHPDVVLVRQRLSMAAYDGDETLLDRSLMAAVSEFMSNAGIPYGRRRGIDDDLRNALNGRRRDGGKGSKARINLILANMERWRWLPHDFGDLYVWNNLPEFESRVVKQGRIIHSERIIIGESQSQTPVFSDSMTRVIFKPDWYVPESIKLSSLWGSLRGGDYAVLKRRNMRIVHQGKEIKPQKIKWASVNARDVPIVQGPGSGNPLGDFKFVFPNKHDVYMHDTTSKHLFEANERTFSHGCIRVRNPQRFAEVILAEGKNWNKADVAWQARTKSTVRIELDRSIPIHNTYFTLVADAGGGLKPFKDMYGHDKRIIDALSGVDPKRIASSDPARALKARNEQLALAAPVAKRRPVSGPPPPATLFGLKQPPPALPRGSRPKRPFYFGPPPPPGYTYARQGLIRSQQPQGLLIFR